MVKFSSTQCRKYRKIEKRDKISKNTQKGVDIYLCMCYNGFTKHRR